MKPLSLIGRVVLWFTVYFVALVIAVVVYFWFFVPDMCANEIISESSSPDGVKRLVMFQRDCGATTGLSTHVSVLSASTPLPNKSGNLYVSDLNHGAAPSGPAVKVAWVSNQSVVLTYHPMVRVFKSESEVDGVRASYIVQSEYPARRSSMAP